MQVATGASIIDMDFFEALGFKHYQFQFEDDTKSKTILIEFMNYIIKNSSLDQTIWT